MRGWICLLLFLLLGALPSRMEVGDWNADFALTGADIDLAAKSCNAGYANTEGGCTAELQRAVYSLTTTLKFGEGTGPSDSLNSLTIQGQGACISGSSPATTGGGTVLRWDGSNLGTMIQIDRAVKLHLKNLCLILDPDMAGGGNAAAIGMLFNGDVATSRYSQGVTLENVTIWGPRTGTVPTGMTGIHITATMPNDPTPPRTAQNDKITLDRVWIDRVDTALKQDALQALVNECRQCSLFAQSTVVYISAGSWIFRGGLGSFRTEGGKLFNFDYQQNATHQASVIEDWYYESGNFCGTIIRIGQGYSSGNTTFGSNAPLLVRGGYYNNQKTSAACTMKFIDGSIQGGVSVVGVNLTTQNNASHRFSVEVSNPTSQPHGRFHWAGNFPDPYVAATIFSPVTKVGDVIWEAYTTSSAGVVFNDLDLDGIQDAGEPSF